VDTVLAWLALPLNRRPAFVTLYFGAVDDAGHAHGPDAPETAAAVAVVDRALGRLVSALEARGQLEHVDVVVVSDHGMAAMAPERVVYLDDYVDVEADAERVLWDEPVGIWPRAGRAGALHAALDAAAIPHVRAWRREGTPAHLHYRASGRIPPLLLMADEGWTVTTRARWGRRPRRGTWGAHGFDPRAGSMGGLLLARGPSFARGATVGPVENVHLYGLFARVLGLRPAPNDGDPRAVRPLFR
jgi:predicted AlkP superfamily pyrophosphatase or phosphodiesterase